jgi:serine/threonine protein kinase
VLVTRGNVVKLADWGLCRFQPEDKRLKMTNPVCTLWYRPPELLLGTGRYTYAVDMWSCGCVGGRTLTYIAGVGCRHTKALRGAQ